MSHALRLHDGLGEIAVDPALGILLGYGNTVPVAALGYSPGSYFLKTNGNSVTTTRFVNIGTRASSNFVAVGLPSTSPTIGVGYATGAGGAVTQATDRTTGVTLNTICGAITTQATSLAAAAEVSFTVTNSAVAIGDVVVAVIRSGPTTVGSTQVYVHTIAAGSFGLTLANLHASVADTGAAIINFAVIKAVSA